MFRRSVIPALHILIIATCMLVALTMLARAASADPQLDPEEQAFVTLINNYRDQNGLGPLVSLTPVRF